MPRILRDIIFLIALLGSLYCFSLSPRMPAMIVLLLCSIAYVSLRWHQKISLVLGLWGLFFVFTILPVDVRFRNVPGPPRFVPYVRTGWPDKEIIAAARRGDIVFSWSCVVHGREPKWILVW